MIDRIEIIARGGNGGNGAVSFRREKYVPRGGPNGGDGGDGGNVILEADRSVRTLKELGRRRVYRAEHGLGGQGSDKHGRNGEDLVLKVPPGTQVSEISAETDTVFRGDLTEHGQRLLVARGGIGGWGNARFATSVHQAPRIAQKGQAGEEVRLRLDLKLLADVGIVGLPNAGKSTLLAQVSAARPKIGDYPFTTIEPSLGVVDVGWQRFVMADIPGLIEGASAGVGLGLDFLRHIERTRLILHLVDGSSPDPLADMQTVNAELLEYGHGLQERPQIVAVNKVDRPDVKANVEHIKERFAAAGLAPFVISAAGGVGVAELMEVIAGTLPEIEAAEGRVPQEETRLEVLRPLEGRLRIVPENGAFRVLGDREVAFAEMMPLESDEGRAEVWRRFQRWGVTGALKRAGAKTGDRVRLGQVELEMQG